MLLSGAVAGVHVVSLPHHSLQTDASLSPRLSVEGCLGGRPSTGLYPITRFPAKQTFGCTQVEVDERVVTVLKKGSYFGEIGLLRACRRTASIRAISETVDLFVLSKVTLAISDAAYSSVLGLNLCKTQTQGSSLAWQHLTYNRVGYC